MPLSYELSVTKVGNSLMIVIPKAVAEGFGLKKGQKLNVIVTDHGMEIPLRGGNK